MSIFDEPKIDCHNHVFDPARFEFSPDGSGRFRGMAIVANDASRRELERLRALRIGGVTFNAASLGAEYYSNAAGLLAELADLGIFADFQAQADQLVDMLPLLEATDARVVVDHCGRPRPGAGLGQPGFAALLRLADTGRVFVKLSG